MQLLEYVYPKRKAVEHSGPEGQPLQVRTTRTQIKAIISNPGALAAVLELEKVLHEKTDSSD
jgi:hypothetical protein